MLNKLLDFLKDKKIVILGFGVEGEASYKFLRKYFPNKKLYIADQKDISTNATKIIKEILKEKAQDLVELQIGNNYLDNLKDFDLILKTPGISFKTINISEFEDKIYTSIDLFLKYYNNVTIGITGTKGKSTVSSLIYEVLKTEGRDVYLLGNIGKPIFSQIEEIKLDSIVIIELSSHQLQFMKYTAQIAILINIFPEHLDHYTSYNEYIECKYNIFINSENMQKIFPKFKQIQIYGKETEAMQSFQYKYNEEAICVDIDDSIYSDIIGKLNLQLKGKHNVKNALFALIVLDILNIDMLKAIEIIQKFKGLAHRLEYVTNYNNVSYYNDSISTIPETTIIALKALKETNTIIIGGLDRGLDYSILVNFFNKIYEMQEYDLKNIILLPDTGYEIEKEIRAEYNKIKVKDIEEAVLKAVEITKKGICLLSPAAASYGFYTNFEERGDVFKDAIKTIKQKQNK